jgi:hypothetical protein
MKLAVGQQVTGQIDAGFEILSGYPIRALVETDMAHFSDPLSYITKGYADTAYLPKASAAPVTVEAVDQLTIKSVSGDGFMSSSVEVAPYEIKLITAYGATVITLTGESLNYSTGGATFNVSHNQFAYTGSNGNGFAFDETTGLGQTGLPAMPSYESYATRGYVFEQIDALQQQIAALEARVAALEEWRQRTEL